MMDSQNNPKSVRRFVGAGSSRIVFDIGNGYVVKNPLDGNDSMGQRQNLTEMRAISYAMAHGLSHVTFLKDGPTPNVGEIVVEKARPLTGSEAAELETSAGLAMGKTEEEIAGREDGDFTNLMELMFGLDEFLSFCDRVPGVNSVGDFGAEMERRGFANWKWVMRESGHPIPVSRIAYAIMFLTKDGLDGRFGVLHDLIAVKLYHNMALSMSDLSIPSQYGVVHRDGRDVVVCIDIGLTIADARIIRSEAGSRIGPLMSDPCADGSMFNGKPVDGMVDDDGCRVTHWFRTEKGSEYVLTECGTTQRTMRNGLPEDGLYSWSPNTFFLDVDAVVSFLDYIGRKDSQKSVLMVQRFDDRPVFKTIDGDTGRWKENDGVIATGRISALPEKKLHPLELFTNVRGVLYGWHVGHSIVDVETVQNDEKEK